MTIRIIKGTYAHWPEGATCSTPVGIGQCIDVSESKGRWLIDIGVGEAVTDTPVSPQEPHSEVLEAEMGNLSTDGETAQNEPILPPFDLERVERMNFAELKALATELGLDVKKLPSKVKLIDAIKGIYEEPPVPKVV